MGRAISLPEIEDTDKFRARIGKFGMSLIGRLALISRALARVLDAEKGGNHQHLTQDAMFTRSHEHACQGHIDGPARHGAADGCQMPLSIHGAQFLQLLPAIVDGALVGHFQEGKFFDTPQAQRQHAQDHPSQGCAQDFRIGIRRPRLEIGFVVEAKTHTRRGTATTPGPLVGAGLADRFDVQTIQFSAHAVTLDPRQSGIDHVTDTRYCERSFRDIGGQHDTAFRSGSEDAILIPRRQAGIQRQHLGFAILAAFQHPMGITNFALAGQKHQDIAQGIFVRGFVHRAHDAIEDTDTLITPARPI